MSLIRILESDDWFVDYDRERGMYRVSYFEDNHFVDELWFNACEEKEVTNKTELIGYLETVKRNGKRIMGNNLCLTGAKFEYFMDNLIINVKKLLA